MEENKEFEGRPPHPETEQARQPATLAQALLRAQQAVGPLRKDAVNAFHNFRYTSAESMFTACRAVLHTEGVLVARGDWELIELREFVALRQQIVLTLVETGEKDTHWFDFPVTPDKGKPWDKAVATTLTVALSYWLRDLLLVPREEEGMNTRDDRGWTPNGPQAAVAPEQVQEAPAQPRPTGQVQGASGLPTPSRRPPIGRPNPFKGPGR